MVRSKQPGDSLPGGEDRVLRPDTQIHVGLGNKRKAKRAADGQGRAQAMVPDHGRLGLLEAEGPVPRSLTPTDHSCFHHTSLKF